MDVVRSTFADQLPRILEAIRSCDFLAFDFEFTGLGLLGAERVRRFDSPQARYAAAKESVDAFLPTQLGLATFRQEKGGDKKWTVDAFNVWMFPQPGPAPFPVESYSPPNAVLASAMDRRFVCQAASMAFLAQHGFDFNRWISEGVGWTSRDAEAILKQEFSKKLERRATPRDPVLPTRPRDIDWLADVQTKVAAFFGLEPVNVLPIVQSRLDERAAEAAAKAKAKAAAVDAEGDSTMAPSSSCSSSTAASSSSSAAAETAASPQQKELLVPTWNGFQRLLVYQLVDRTFPDLHAEKVEQEPTPDGKPPRGPVSLRLRPLSEEEKRKADQEMLEQSQKDFENALKEAAGVRRLFDAVAEAGKPIIGHNCLLDLCHLYAAFLGPLPSSYLEFKRRLGSVLPLIFDTKHIAEHKSFQASLASDAAVASVPSATATIAAAPETEGERPRKRPRLNSDSAANTATTAPAEGGKPAEEKKKEEKGAGAVASLAPPGIGSSTVLGHLHALTQSAGFIGGDAAAEPVFELSKESERYNDTSAEHEAGYDAYLTGSAFARILYRHQARLFSSSSSSTSSSSSSALLSSAAFTDFSSVFGNRVCIMAEACMYLGGPDDLVTPFGHLLFLALPSPSTAAVDGEAEAKELTLEFAGPLVQACASSVLPFAADETLHMDFIPLDYASRRSGLLTLSRRRAPATPSFSSPSSSSSSASSSASPSAANATGNVPLLSPLSYEETTRLAAALQAKRPPLPFTVCTYVEAVGGVAAASDESNLTSTAGGSIVGLKRKRDF